MLCFIAGLMVLSTEFRFTAQCTHFLSNFQTLKHALHSSAYLKDQGKTWLQYPNTVRIMYHTNTTNVTTSQPPPAPPLSPTLPSPPHTSTTAATHHHYTVLDIVRILLHQLMLAISHASVLCSFNNDFVAKFSIYKFSIYKFSFYKSLDGISFAMSVNYGRGVPFLLSATCYDSPAYNLSNQKLFCSSPRPIAEQ